MRAKKRDKSFNATLLNLKRGLVTAILVVSVLAMFITVASATDYYVRTGGLDNATHDGLANTDDHAWETISYAIGRGEVTAGDTIHVAAGDYTENVNVSKRLTIKSETGSDLTIVQAKNSSKHVFKVSVDYVNITGFQVKNANGDKKAGICLKSVDYCNISNNKASKNDIGINLYESCNNHIMDNIANNNTRPGIGLSSSSNYNNITGNTAKNNGRAGIGLNTSSRNNTLTGNTANNNERAGIGLNSSNNSIITNNDLSSNKKGGIHMKHSSNNTIMGNTANSNTEYGIFLENADNNNITCNWVAHNEQRGFNLKDGSTGNNIRYNNIMSNGVYNATSEGWEWNFYNGQSNAVVAEHNYWGTTSSVVIEAGIKEDTGSVDYDPFETASVPCAPIPEVATIILLSIGLVVLAGYVWIRKRR